MIYASDSSRAQYIAKLLTDYALTSESRRAIIEDKNLAITIGGDGFFLEMIKKLPKDTEFLPLNGGSLGYTLNDAGDDDLVGILAEIENKNWKKYIFPKFSCYFRCSDGREVLLAEGVNDLCIERESGQTVHLNLKIDDIEMLSGPVICDGIIIATALGSTAYNLSAGGPVIHPELKVFGITFNNAHHPRVPPMVIPGNCSVAVIAKQQDKRPVRIVCDGREIKWKDKSHRMVIEKIIVRYEEDKQISVLYFNGHCRTNQLAKKIIQR